jgi:hypothetical protein
VQERWTLPPEKYSTAGMPFRSTFWTNWPPGKCPQEYSTTNQLTSQILSQFLLTLNYSHFFSVADPDPGLGAFLTPGSGIRDPGWEKVSIQIRDEPPGSYFLELRNHFLAFFLVKILKFFDEDPGSGIRDGDSSDPGSGMEKSRIRDPG